MAGEPDGPDGGSYLGVPLVGDDGAIPGVLVAFSPASRQWTEGDIRSLLDLAACAATTIASRSAGEKAELHLGLQNAVGVILGKSATFEEAVGSLLDVVGESLGFDVGELWVPDLASGELRRHERDRAVGSGGLNFSIASRAIVFRRGEGLPGRIWERLEPMWLIVSDPGCDFRRTAQADAAGLRTALGFPIVADSQLLGVMTFLASRAIGRDDVLLRTLKTLGRQIGEFVVRSNAEAEARGVNRRLNALLDASNQVSIIATDVHGVITTFNTGAERLLGYDRREMIGLRTPEVIHLASEVEEHAERIREEYGVTASGFDAFVERARRGDHEEREWTYLRKDGGSVSVSLTVTAVRDAAGRIDGFLGIAIDITEEKAALGELRRARDELDFRVAERTEQLARTNDLLKESERQIYQLADAMPQIIWTSRPDGYLDYYNQRWYDFTGFNRGGSGDDSWMPILHPDDQDRCLDEWYRSIETGQPYENQYRFRDRRTGLYRWHLGRALPVRDVAGRIIRWYGTSTDIDDLKRIESDRAYLATIVDSTGDAIVSKDLDGFITSWNVGAERLFGYTAAESVGRSSSFLIPPGCEREEAEILRRLRNGESVNHFESMRLTKDGRSVFVSLRISPIMDGEGRVIGISKIARDITEKKEAEAAIHLLNADLERRVESRTSELVRANGEAEAANRAKASFLANMSHEVRTPMAAVLGYADMLLDPMLSPGDRDHSLRAIRRNGAHLMHVIDDILDISKFEAGRMELELIAYSPWQIAMEVASILQIRAKERSVRIETRATGLLPAFGFMDPTRVRQILTNLVSNAIKFADRGGRVQVRVAFDPASDGGPALLRFEVEDTGIGMTSAQIDQLFTPFQQADTTTTRRFGGSGLGLSICHRLIHAMGGRISVRSEPGGGSLFTATIPLSIPGGEVRWFAPGELVSVTTEAPLSDDPSGRRTFSGRILLVEDSPEISHIITHTLERMGLEVQKAENGLIGVDLAMSGSFDLILMDMQMPEMDGYCAASSIRRSGLRVPIVALTAHVMAEDRERSLRAGCDDYLTKPVAAGALASMLAKYLHSTPTTPRADLPGEGRRAGITSESEELSDLTRDFAATLAAKTARLRSCLVSRDFEGLSFLAHQLRGVAGMYGFPSLTETAGLIEDAIHEGQEPALIGGLIEEFAEDVATIDLREDPRSETAK